MNMLRLLLPSLSRLLLPILVLGLALLCEPAPAAAAKRITLQNATGYPIDTVLVVQTRNGWRVRGWYRIAPYSYRNINYNDAGGQAFAYYARHIGPGGAWQGKGNDPTIAIVNNAMNHSARQQPHGNNLRHVKVRIKQGNSVKFTSSSPQQRRNTGWW